MNAALLACARVNPLPRRSSLAHCCVNSGDEDMNGIGPNAATETCDVSDFIYSNSWLLRVTGRSKFGDHLERAFFNAAPGAVSRIANRCPIDCRPDMT